MVLDSPEGGVENVQSSNGASEGPDVAIGDVGAEKP